MKNNKTIEFVKEALTACRNLSEDSDFYDSFERKERYDVAKYYIDELNKHLSEQGILELKKLNFDNPFNSEKNFLIIKDGKLINI